MSYIPINREMFSHPFWKEQRSYSRAEAWIDLVQSANFEGGAVLVGGKLIELKRGQVAASRRFLEKRWSWGSSKVKSFIKGLISAGEVTQQTTQGQTIITLCKYDTWAPKRPTNNPHPTQGKLQNGQQPTQQSTQYQPILSRCNVDSYELTQPVNNPPNNPKPTHGQPKEKEYNELNENSKTSDELPHKSEAFAKAWAEWEQHRKEKRQKLTPSTREKQLAKLSKINESDAIATINNSIDQGYTGLFPDKFTGGKASQQSVSRLDGGFNQGESYGQRADGGASDEAQELF